MSLSIGIVGLPNVGKSTLFKALTRNPVDISNYPFCTIEPNVGIVEVPDSRLQALAQVAGSEKIVPSIIKFVDVAGLVKGAAQGEGLGNQFLAHLRETDALLHIVRCFSAEDITHVEGSVDPKRDIETVESELILKDLETVEKRMQKIERDVKQGKKEAKLEEEVLKSLREKLNQGILAISFLENLALEKRKFVEGLFLLTSKPQLYLLNGNEKEVPQDFKKELEAKGKNWIQLDLREELDKSELTEEERKELGLESSKLESLIKKCYEMLHLITFFTIAGGTQTQAWAVKKGSSILEGVEKIHSDFKEKFIQALVINWEKLVEIGDWKKCQELGLLRTVGRDYILEDGDVVEVKI